MNNIKNIDFRKGITQEVKDLWLTALKSGDYVQGTGQYMTPSKKEGGTVRHCCLGVLCEVVGGKFGDYGVDSSLDDDPKLYPYNLPNALNLYSTNDNQFDPDNPDYSNVIPLIEAMEVVD